MPGCQPWRRSPVCVQHAVSTHPVPSSGSGCPAVWCAARLVSSPSGVQPVRCPVTWVRRPGPMGPAVWCPPVQRPALWCPPPSIRTRPSPPTSGGGVGDQMGATGQPAPRERVEVPVAAAPSSGSVNGRGLDDRGRRYRGRALVGGMSAADPAGLGEGGGGRACPLSDQVGQAGVRSARGWRLRCGHGAGCSARLPHRWRGCCPGLGATTVGGCRGAWGPGGRARQGRWACRRGWAAAPARPRLAASIPGSLLTAL
jgi:hypothetical protein